MHAYSLWVTYIDDVCHQPWSFTGRSTQRRSLPGLRQIPWDLRAYIPVSIPELTLSRSFLLWTPVENPGTDFISQSRLKPRIDIFQYRESPERPPSRKLAEKKWDARGERARHAGVPKLLSWTELVYTFEKKCTLHRYTVSLCSSNRATSLRHHIIIYHAINIHLCCSNKKKLPY